MSVLLISYFFFRLMFKVCDDRHSELIPCLDRHLIYQLRLKLDLSLMEHYERHCPPQERRYNCLIPPPHGYKVRIPFIFLISNSISLFQFLVWKLTHTNYYIGSHQMA